VLEEIHAQEGLEVAEPKIHQRRDQRLANLVHERLHLLHWDEGPDSLGDDLVGEKVVGRTGRLVLLPLLGEIWEKVGGHSIMWMGEKTEKWYYWFGSFGWGPITYGR
jgi:hypothetical protein